MNDMKKIEQFYNIKSRLAVDHQNNQLEIDALEYIRHLEAEIARLNASIDKKPTGQLIKKNIALEKKCDALRSEIAMLYDENTKLRKRLLHVRAEYLQLFCKITCNRDPCILECNAWSQIWKATLASEPTVAEHDACINMPQCPEISGVCINIKPAPKPHTSDKARVSPGNVENVTGNSGLKGQEGGNAGDPCDGCKYKDGNRCETPTGSLYRFDKRNFAKLPCDRLVQKYEKRGGE